MGLYFALALWLLSGDPLAETPLAAAALASDAAAQIVEIDTADFQFTPGEATVVRGRPVILRVTARDSPHAFGIPSLDTEVLIMPSETGDLHATFDELGEVTFRCRFHYRQGMVGTLYVVDEPQPAETRDAGAVADAEEQEP